MPLLRALGGLLLMAAGLAAQQYPFVPVAQSPRNIEHILEDRQGRLWIGTHDDVLCFDGVRFFSLHRFGYPTQDNNSLSEDWEGGIWIAAGDGLYRFFQGHLERILAGVSPDETIAVTPDILLVTAVTNRYASERLLYRIRRVSGQWRAERIAGWNAGMALTRDRSGAVLTACRGGWCEWPVQAITNWTAGQPLQPVFHPLDLPFDRVLRDRFGCLWFRSSETGAYQCPGDRKPVSLPASVAGRSVWVDEHENADGSILFSSVGSLAMGRPGAFQVAEPANGLPAEAITCAVRSRDGAIWVGSIAGLYRFPYPFRMTYWKSRHGLFWSFARSGDGIFAGSSAGVTRLSRRGEWDVLPGSREFGTVSSVLPAGGGGIYAAISLEGIVHLRADGSLAARTPAGRGGKALKLARAADGSLWMAGAAIYRVRERSAEISLEPDPSAPELGPEPLIAVDREGGLWGCYAGKVIRREGGEWRTVADSDLPPGACRALAFPPNGEVWAGFIGGFARIRPGGQGAPQAKRFQSGGDIGNAITYTLDSDTRGWLWRGSRDEIYVADPSQAERGVWSPLDLPFGVIDTDVNHGAFWSDPDGSVWWAADASIVHFFPPPELVHPAAPPAVFLSAFSANGSAPEMAEAGRPLPARRKLTAHLGSLQFQGRGAIRVRYRLLPEERDWRESAALDLDLGTPRWGSHTLEIQSRFSTGDWSPAASWPMVVLRPWWLSWIALLAFAGAGAGGAVGGLTWRRKRQTRAAIDLPDLTDWRMAILSPESELVGSTLDHRFLVLEMVARGGFATVLKGRDLRHQGRPCAIKVFRREVVDEEWLTHRFQQEVAALEQIHHPSVVSIYGQGVAPAGAPYLAMEFIEGGTLRDLLNQGPPGSQRSASLLRQAAAALEQIHAHGIYHRDLKPENLMLRAGALAGQELVLIDFSIAIVKEPDQTIHGLSRAAGTIYYMAPEQAVGFATAASDVYSLAKIVLELLTGRRLSVLLPNASMDLPERVRELARGLPVRLSEESVNLLGAALEFDPSRRPSSASEFAQPIVRDLAAPSSGP